MDYTKQKNRIKALDNLNAECLKAFRNFELSKDAIIEVQGSQVVISFREQDKESSYYGHAAFASEIRINAKYKEYGSCDTCELSVGSCGSFKPKNKGVYWRAIHAAEILKNWKAACDIVNSFCKKYRELSEEINQLNKG